LKSAGINSPSEEDVIPAAISAISRGDLKPRGLNATLGKTYYDRFIRPSQNDRLKQFVFEDTNPLDRGFIPISVDDLDNPFKAFQRKTIVSRGNRKDLTIKT
jgi:hypothetical protein